MSPTAVQRISRTLMSVLFLVAGIRKLIAWDATVAYLGSSGLPLAELIVPLVVLLEIGGAVALIAGWRLRELSILLAFYSVATALIAHRFWSVDPAQFNSQLNNFFKNIAIAGGFLLLWSQNQRQNDNRSVAA
ncbi:DoxX family protein (plasmid) [Paraburkholderia strydomiana]